MKTTIYFLSGLETGDLWTRPFATSQELSEHIHDLIGRHTNMTSAEILELIDKKYDAPVDALNDYTSDACFYSTFKTEIEVPHPMPNLEIPAQTVKTPRHWLIIGRTYGADEATSETYSDVSEQEAIETFIKANAPDEETLEYIKKNLEGSDFPGVYIDATYSSDTPIQ